MSDRTVRIDIKSTADNKGIDDSKKGISDLGDAGAKTTAKMRGAASAASALAGALGQGQGGVAATARTASGALAGLSAGWIGIATVILTSVIAAYNKFREIQKKVIEDAIELARQHKLVSEGLKRISEQKLDALVRQYSDVEKAASAAYDAVDRLTRANMALEDAKTKRQISEIDAEESKALNKVDPEDEIAVEKVKLEYTKKRADVQNAAAIRAAQDESDAVNAKLKSDIDAQDRAIEFLNKVKTAFELSATDKNKKSLDAQQAVVSGLGRDIALDRVNLETADTNVATAFAKARQSRSALSGATATLDSRETARDDARRSAADELTGESSKLYQQRDALLMQRYSAEADVETAARRVRPTNRFGKGVGQDDLARAEAALSLVDSTVGDRLKQIAEKLEALNSKFANQRLSD